MAREELARHAVTAERVRIARELHDVVAHSMTIVAMHAGVGRLAVGTDPRTEVAALQVIEETTRSALGEMRRLVAVLREEGRRPQLGPVQGLGDLPVLTAAVAAAGVTVDVRTSGDLAALPAGVSLAAFRVVQEALTNVVRHAGPARARVVVTAGDDGTVDVCVENDPGEDDRSAGPAGRREAVTAWRACGNGWSCTAARSSAGPTSEGGWRVTATLPAGRRPSGSPR